MQRTIDDLNLIDNFLMNAVASDREVGEKCIRKIVSVLLQKDLGQIKVIPERILPAPLPEMRGIRMDVEVTETGTDGETRIYDVEPHRGNDIGQIPRRNRFYQAKIDSRGMKSGSRDFTKLPNLYMVFITDYDLFGKDYMQYTFRNVCKEVPEIEYDDGLTYVYFNTKGTLGGSQEISNMLKYIQNSREESVVDDATQTVSDYVNRVRKAPEISEGFMTFGELLDYEHKEGYEEGREEGRKEGRLEEMKRTDEAIKRAEAAEARVAELEKKLEESSGNTSL